MTPLTLIRTLLGFGMLVLVPWAMTLEGHRPRGAVRMFWVAAPFALLTLLMPEGWMAAAFTLPWLLFTALVALNGLGAPLERLHQLYLPVGGAWFLLSRYGQNPMGFSEPIVSLTAIHFHYAAFLAPILIRTGGRHLGLPSWLTRGCYFGILAATPILAAGISFSREIEAVGGALFAVSLSAFALASLLRLGRVTRGRTWLAISALSALFTMALAFLYATTRPLDIATMARLHGIVNALGFVAAGLVGWTLEELRIFSRWKKISPDFDYWESAAPTSGFHDEAKLFRSDVHETNLGQLSEAQLDRARDRMFAYQIFPRHRIEPHFRGEQVREGTCVVQQIILGAMKVETAVKVVRCEKDGFWVATLKGHVERGLEGFLLSRAEDGSVVFRIVAHSQPAHWWVWAIFPLARYWQRKYSREALQAFKASSIA